MNNEQKNINTDSFTQKVKDKLANHQMPVDEGLWARIESDLHPTKKQRIPIWWLFPLGSTAVISLFLLVRSATYFPDNHSTKISAVSNTTFQPINKQMQEVSAVKNSHQISQQLPTTHTQCTNRNLHKKPNGISAKATNATGENINNQSYKTSYEVPSTEENNSGKNRITTNADSTNTQVKPNKPLAQNPFVEKNPKPETIKKVKKPGWTIAAVISLGNNTSQSFNNRTVTPTVSGTGSINTTTPDINLFSDVKYNMPLSTGIKIEKTISKKLSIESGLIYTYLQTDFTASNIDAQYKLHYIGLPVNLKYTLWNNRNINLSISAGGMVEKGIQSIYTYNELTTIGTQTNITTDNIDGLQWSLNALADASYKFLPQVSLYFEPHLSYYFDNNQPISIRTNQRVVFGLQMGLRYGF